MFRNILTCFLIPCVLMHCSTLSFPSQGTQEHTFAEEESSPNKETLPLLPTDLSQEQAKQIGKQVLTQIGFENLMQLALITGLIEKIEKTEPDSSFTVQPISLDIAESGYVFSRWATSALITSQLDTPLPGPADIAALGLLAIGLFDALLLQGYLSHHVLSSSDSSASDSSALSSSSSDTLSYDHTPKMKQLSPELQANIDALLQTISHWMAQKGHRNVKDTQVIELMQALITTIATAQGISRDTVNQCDILRKMYKDARDDKDFQFAEKIRSTLKGFGCANMNKTR